MSDTTVMRRDGAVWLQPAGDVVASSVPGLRETLRGAIAEGAREMVWDLSNVRMLDSAGIGLLIAAHNSMRKLAGMVRVTGASGEIVDLLKTMRIHQHIKVAGA